MIYVRQSLNNVHLSSKCFLLHIVSDKMAEYIRKRDYLDEVEESTRKGILMDCRGFIEQLLLCRRANPQARVDAVDGQARIARERGRKEWLKCVAKDALVFQFISREWVSRNLFSSGREKRRNPVCQMPTGRSRDIRLLTNPNLERREENAATSTSAVPISSTSVIVEDDFPPLTISAGATIPVSARAVVPVATTSASLAAEEELPLNVSLNASIPSEEERALLSEGDPDQHSEEPIKHHEFMETQSSNIDGSPSKDYLCPQRDLVKEFEPVVRPLGQKYVPVSRSPVRYQASEQSRQATSQGPYFQESLEFRRSGRRSPYRRSAGSATVKTKRRSDTSSPRRRQDRHQDSDKRRRLDAYHPKNRTVTVEPSCQPVIRSDGKSKTSPHQDLNITVFRSAEEEAPHSQSEHKNPRQKRAAARRLKRREQQPPCPVSGCDVPNRYPKRHAFDCHVPNLFDEDLDVEDVTCRRLAALKLAAVWLLGMRATVYELTRYVDSMGLLSEDANREVTASQTTAMRALCEEMCIEPPEVFTLYPLNSPASLFHWRAMLLIVAQLEPRHRESLFSQFQYFPLEVAAQPEVREVTEQPLSVFPDAYDSHFHLDRSRDHHNLSKMASLQQLCAKVIPNDTARVRLVGAVANFCDPDTYPTREEVAALYRQGVKVCIGMHPNPRKVGSISENHLTEMKKLLQLPEISGLGEVGLDRTAPISKWNSQLQVLNKVIGFLQDRHVLVLHCRGVEKEDPSEVYSTVLMHLKGRVRRDQAIHVHCFTGNKDIVKSWLEEFPRTFFGITRIVQNFTRDQLEGIRAVDDERILLETDAPYFGFRSLKHTAPNTIGMTAEVVAKARNSSATHLLLVSTANAMHLYSGGLIHPI